MVLGTVPSTVGMQHMCATVLAPGHQVIGLVIDSELLTWLSFSQHPSTQTTFPQLSIGVCRGPRLFSSCSNVCILSI